MPWPREDIALPTRTLSVRHADGFSSDLPATFMYAVGFTRNQIGLGAASAMMMLATVIAVVVPMMYAEVRSNRRG